MLLHVLSVLSLILSLAGNILVNYKKRYGFVVWIASNISWIVVNLVGYTNWPQIIMYIVYAVLNVQGFILWSRGKHD